MPFFSVIIPLYNKEDYIENTLKSVLSQSFQNFEVIIINDGSKDNSLKIIEKFNDARIIILNQENAGAAASRNKGINAATSEYISLLDADDIWRKNHLLELKKQIEIFPEAGLYCNNYQVHYRKNMSRPASFNFTYDSKCLIVKDYFKASIINSVAWTSGVAFTKEKFNQLGKFDLSLKTAQDLDLWIRFALEYDVSFNPTITMDYKLYVDNSLSKKEFNEIRYQSILKFKEEEKMNSSLKQYLDLNRYALALRSKVNGEKDIYVKVKKEIDKTHLNSKQQFLLNMPVFMLRLMKDFQNFLINNGIYLTAFK